MATLDFTEFHGMIPKISPRSLKLGYATVAKNCDTQTGQLKPIVDPTLESTHAGETPKTIWKYGTTIFHFADDEVNSVIDLNVDEALNRFAWTDGILPKQSDSTHWEASQSFHRLGVPAPTATPVMTHTGTPGADVQDYVSYVFTMVTSWGEESAPSPATVVETVMTGEGINLSGLTSPTSQYSDFQYKRIYRISSGTAGAVYQFLAQIAAANTTFSDFDGVDSLKEVQSDILGTKDWDIPPDDLQGLRHAHNGMLIGYVGKKLYISEPGVPYAWPENYTQVFDSDITGIESSDEYILVVTENYPYILSGSEPESIIPDRKNIQQSCVSFKGMVGTPLGLIYPSPDGLCLCNGSTITVLTEESITKEQWAAYTPSNLISVWYDSIYYGFFTGTNIGIIYKPKTGELFTIEFETPADKIYDAYLDPVSDTLYLLFQNAANTNAYIYSYATASTVMDLIWTSGDVTDRIEYTCAKVIGDFSSGSLIFKYYLDGILVLSEFVISDEMFTLPGSAYSNTKKITLMGNLASVDFIRLATTPEELI